MAEETPVKDKVQELLDTSINPAVAGHGGFIELIDVKDSTVYLRMSGGCQGCGAADVTLKAGIERMIKEEIPEVTEILDVAANKKQGLARCEVWCYSADKAKVRAFAAQITEMRRQSAALLRRKA